MNAQPNQELIPLVEVQQRPDLAVALARAEVDQQISTARAYPRSIDRAVKNIITLATLDEETATECIFALPRGGKPIVGPSIRLAEIIASQWGNCRVATRVTHTDRTGKVVEAEGIFHDLETNTASSARVQRRIVDSRGRLYSDDLIIVTGNAAASIAKRNAILGGVPKAVWRKAYEAAASVVRGTSETLVVTREKSLKAFAAFGVTPERVFAAIGVTGTADITLEHILTLRGMFAALKNSEATVEELFGDLKPSSAAVAPPDIPDETSALSGAQVEAAPPQEGNAQSSAPAVPSELPQTDLLGDPVDPGLPESEDAIIQRLEIAIDGAENLGALKRVQRDLASDIAKLSSDGQALFADLVDCRKTDLQRKVIKDG